MGTLKIQWYVEAGVQGRSGSYQLGRCQHVGGNESTRLDMISQGKMWNKKNSKPNEHLME